MSFSSAPFLGWRHECQLFPEVRFPQQYPVKAAIPATAVLPVEVIESFATAMGAVAVLLYYLRSCCIVAGPVHAALFL
jgi:hypothetical protein